MALVPEGDGGLPHVHPRLPRATPELRGRSRDGSHRDSRSRTDHEDGRQHGVGSGDPNRWQLDSHFIGQFPYTSLDRDALHPAPFSHAVPVSPHITPGQALPLALPAHATPLTPEHALSTPALPSNVEIWLSPS
ncbi:hypothetical protein GCM10017600_13150 [Streptosporangium carneum]|uniref:Uncharacterized protein n=1 Tax=Streptosporangium carneum TaxID=47481 RepID=A0A9W6HYX0_9ACTN|nr:hypothetical protein GCM10017600_13150 [Streptosporangium carneum]